MTYLEVDLDYNDLVLEETPTDLIIDSLHDLTVLVVYSLDYLTDLVD